MAEEKRLHKGAGNSTPGSRCEAFCMSRLITLPDWTSMLLSFSARHVQVWLHSQHRFHGTSNGERNSIDPSTGSWSTGTTQSNVVAVMQSWLACHIRVWLSFLVSSLEESNSFGLSGFSCSLNLTDVCVRSYDLHDVGGKSIGLLISSWLNLVH